MQPKWTRRLGLAGLVGAIVYASVGCAEQRPAINQVQPNALSKHFFVGADLSDKSDDPQFYMRNTVIDVPFGAAQDGLFTASYAQPLSRVRWEISENALIARLTYDRIQNTGNQAEAAANSGAQPPDGNGAKTVTDGQVVAMFNIQSHFDIRRSYNPQTGEEFNVIVENASDRPWYQREYMRVDWSKNMITDGYDFDTMSQIGIFGAIKWDPQTYEITDPNDPNAPAFDMDTGYFDITTKAFASPNTVETPFGTFPACFLPADYGGTNIYPVANCSPTEITLRLSFKRVVDNDFEPSDWDGNKMEAFGWFTEDRFGYDKNYGVVDQNWHRFAAKYNIWQQSHIQGSQCAVDFYRDANGAVQKYKSDGAGGFSTDGTTGLPIPAGPGDTSAQPYPSTPIGADPHRLASDGLTEQECAFADINGNIVHQGAYCDVSTNKCSLPQRERKIRTIPWYYGPDSAPDLFASTGRALDQWNVAVKRAAVIGQMTDAKRVGADMSAPITGSDGTALATEANGYPSEQTLYTDKSDAGQHVVPNVFVLCHNPVIDGDDPSCGPAGLKARVGDIRYNMINIIPTPQSPSPWGIMVDGNDPLTGEKVQTSVNEWGAVLDIASQGTEDLLRWINGEITDQQIINGGYMRDWVNASKLGTGSYQGKQLSAQDIQDRIAAADTTTATLNGLSKTDSTPKVIQRLAAAKNLAKNLGPSLDSKFEGMRSALLNSKYEAALIDSHFLQTAGFDPQTPFAGNEQITAMASPLRGMNPQLQKWLRRQKAVTMAQNGFCEVQQPEPDSLVGMARMALKLYPLPNSKDPNYAALKNQRDQSLHQWIREQFHVSVIAHEMGHSMGLRHNFTGSFDALNYKPEYWQLRSRNGQEKACTNVFTPNTDGTTCVGPRWMDPITEPEVNGMIWKWGSTTVMDYPGDQTQDMNDIGSYDKAAMRFCYGQTVDVDNDALTSNNKGASYITQLDGFGGIAGQSVGGFHYSRYNDQFHILGNCSAPTDPNDPLTAKCDGFKLDYLQTRDMTTVPKYGPQYLTYRPDLVSNFAVDTKTKRVRHPYMFGSDEFADIGNVPVFRFDAGADTYEQIQFITSTYENRYIFDNFRRNRTTFQSINVMNRVNDRYFDKLKDITKTFGLMLGLSANPQADQQDPGNLMPLALAGPDMLATFLRVITRPEPGMYTITTTGSGLVLPLAQENFSAEINGLTPGQPGGADFGIPVGSGDGRFIENDYDYTQGYFWGSYQKQAGSWAEKRDAVIDLTEAHNYFVANSQQDYVDGRYKNLNFASVYPHQVKRFFSQVLAGDPMTLGPYVTIPTASLGSATPSVMYLPWEKDLPLDYPASADVKVLDPLVGWQDQFPTYFYAYMYGATNLYEDTKQELRLWSPGDISSADIAASDQIRFRDPVSGIVYAARTYGTEQVNSKVSPVQRTVGARMLQYAQQLTDLAYTKKTVGNIPDPAGGGFVYDTYDTATPKDAVVAAKLHGYISNLDEARGLSVFMTAFDYGNVTSP